MPRDIPRFVLNAGIIGSKVDFMWGKTVSRKILTGDINDRLYHAVIKSTFKAAFAIGIAATEWIVFRLSTHTNVTDALNRIEAAWASEISLPIAKDLKFRLTEKADDSRSPVEGALEIALVLLSSIHGRYSKSDWGVQGTVVRQLSLAQHVLPETAGFAAWLAESLRRLSAAFPQHGDPEKAAFDWSPEGIVPREFFEADFVYSKESTYAALKAFLASLNPAQNPYLRTAEEMKANGFSGVPYTF